jgi:hypothetical protein
MQSDRATRLGVTIAVAAVLFIVLGCTGVYLLIRFAPSSPASAYDAEVLREVDWMVVEASTSRANASVVMTHGFREKLAASAVFDLPPVPPQKDSPSLQTTFYQRGAYIQGGIIRTPANHFRMNAFLVGGSSSFPKGYTYNFGFLPDGPHVVALAGDAEKIDFTIDGKLIDRLPRAKYLPVQAASATWLMLGTIVDTPGDSAYGTISNIEVLGDGDAALVPVVPKCVVTKGGLEMRRDGDRWILGGTFTHGVDVRYARCTRRDKP